MNFTVNANSMNNGAVWATELVLVLKEIQIPHLIGSYIEPMTSVSLRMRSVDSWYAVLRVCF